MRLSVAPSSTYIPRASALFTVTRTIRRRHVIHGPWLCSLQQRGGRRQQLRATLFSGSNSSTRWIDTRVLQTRTVMPQHSSFSITRSTESNAATRVLLSQLPRVAEVQSCSEPTSVFTRGVGSRRAHQRQFFVSTFEWIWNLNCRVGCGINAS